ncbi:hypothetical protein E2562_001544 [Oryza meyeriana var. granulata]|uniref:Pre-mRNA polyadenylation factor Fip1 domain-containing protein n=1 Tax=Oryza meyeriana var. granulata TaxID=110450 RepID=A0A6G1DDX3_9ORYZ|nr:hypothetical protein E2562_001544 [Oryza meyeriana var. granulata]
MEDDDEFGGLYTDILVHAPAPSNPPPAAETLAPTPPAPNPNATPTSASTKVGAAADEEEDDDWLLGGSDPVVGVDPTGDWADEEEGDGGGAPPPKREAAAKPPLAADEADPLMGGVAGESGAAIPGLSLSASAAGAAAGSEEWDSDSEDDIQIVLNETDGRRRLGEDEGDDEDGEDLVIVADGPIPGMEEQEWGEDAAAAGAEGERKEGGESGKAVATPGGRIGYSGGGQGFHPQHHSMFKYVRPGATPGAPLGGAPNATGQFRPPGLPGPFAGRGKGDWRPGAGRGMNKGFHPGYGMPPWGGSGRGFGGGLDFTLPPHKTIFDIDVDTTFEEKPWKYPGADISDFFNFGLDDEKWKDYCKQLDQLRLESTMQSRIRVYESGRSEQDYDPDLPPELAAATGHHDISADNRNKTDNGHTDFNAQGRVPTSMRPPVMTGRPIQVETGFGERLPSIDTRLPRMRESDSVIEIVCQGQSDDPLVDSTVDQTEKDSQGGDKRTHGTEGRPYTSEMNNSHSSAFGKEEHKRRLPISSEDDATDVNGHSSPSYRTRGSPRGVRSSKGSSRGLSSAREIEGSNEVLPRQATSSKRNRDSRRDNNPDEGSESKDGPEGSPTAADEAADKLSTDQFDGNDGSHALVDRAEVDGDDAISDPHGVSETTDGDNLAHSDKKWKIISRAEQPTGHNSSDQDELRTRNSDNSRGRSGSSKENQKRLESGEEVLQDRRSRRVNDVRRHHDGEERNSHRKDEYHRDIKPDAERSHLASRSREDTHHPYANRDRDIRGRSYDRVRETEIWQRREDSVHNRRAKEEDVRLEHSAEVGARSRNKMRPIDRNDRDEDPHARKRLDDGDWRCSRQRERGDVLNRRENIDDSHMKRKKDEENMRRMKPENEDIVHGQHGYRARDDPNRRKREQDDGVDQKRRDDNARMREKADDRYHTKHKEDNWRQREREDRHRPKHDNTVTLQRDEGRGSGRGGRILDDKLVSGDRKQDESRSAGLSKEVQERSRQNEPLRRDQGAEENNMQIRGRSDVHPRDDNPNNSERNARQDKLNNNHDNNNRLSSNSGARQVSRDRYRESGRKGRNSDINEQDLPKSGKRRREDHETHRSGKVDAKGVSEQGNSRDHAMSSKKSQNPQRDALMKQVEEDPMSDDENHEDSRRGRSKLERWTSHKEIDYSSIDNENAPAFSSIKSDVQAPTADELGKSETAAVAGNSELKSGGDAGQTSDKTTEERDRHLDTVERLKRRSERFKLPMPREKDAPQSKKADSEVQPPQIESAAADLEVKPERPARKRRWTGS